VRSYDESGRRKGYVDLNRLRMTEVSVVRLRLQTKSGTRGVGCEVLLLMLSSFERRVELLRRVPYFAGLPTERVQQIAARLEERYYGRGQVITSAEHASDGLYVVLSGRASAVLTSSDGRERVVRSFGRGRTFGEIAAFGGGMCPGIVRAAVPTRVGLIRSADINQVVTQDSRAALGALRLFATRLRAATRLAADMSLRPVAARVADLLLDVARGDPSIVEDVGTVVLGVTHHELAAMVGSVRAVVQRELKALERAGAIRLGRANIEILDALTLERWTQRRTAPGTSHPRH
jgi:CRP-like cAMP-binding protein